MEIVLSKRTVPFQDKPVKTDRAAGLEYLERYAAEKVTQKAGRDLADYTDDELYEYKDRIKRERVKGRGPDAAHRRWYKKEMLKRINADLKRRKLPATRPGDTRRYGPGCAPWQGAGAKEAA